MVKDIKNIKVIKKWEISVGKWKNTHMLYICVCVYVFMYTYINAMEKEMQS